MYVTMARDFATATIQNKDRLFRSYTEVIVKLEFLLYLGLHVVHFSKQVL